MNFPWAYWALTYFEALAFPINSSCVFNQHSIPLNSFTPQPIIFSKKRILIRAYWYLFIIDIKKKLKKKKLGILISYLQAYRYYLWTKIKFWFRNFTNFYEWAFTIFVRVIKSIQLYCVSLKNISEIWSKPNTR